MRFSPARFRDRVGSHLNLTVKWVKKRKSLLIVITLAGAIMVFLTWLAFLDLLAIGQASSENKIAFSSLLAQMEFTLLGFSFFLLGVIITQKLSVTSSTSDDAFYRRFMMLLTSLLLLTLVTAYMSLSYIALPSDL